MTAFVNKDGGWIGIFKKPSKVDVTIIKTVKVCVKIFINNNLQMRNGKVLIVFDRSLRPRRGKELEMNYKYSCVPTPRRQSPV